jgi:hypothetical protein
MNVAQVGDEYFLGSQDKWLKVSPEEGQDMGSAAKEISGSISETLSNTEEGSELKYEGLEELDGVQVQKFAQEGTESGYIWFDASKKLPVRMEMEGMLVDIVYETNIEKPSDFEDITGLDEMEQASRIFELMFGGQF